MEEEAQSVKKSLPIQENNGDLRKLTTAELSALCSNLARGCEKQYLEEEAKLFGELSEYFKERTPAFENFDIHQLRFLIEKDLNESFDNVNAVAKANDDRGAQRAIVWGEKVTRIIHSILSRYEKEGDAFLENTNIYVCEVCGFIYVGDNPPELCPVCKVPSWKFNKIERS
ncbi:MAG: rubredoxin-like domain-containing protein [Anaerotignaceae bacterium]